eukprot:349676-Chlamydomonas_euryale.AAC.6
MRSPAACELNDTCYLSSGTTHGQGSQSIRVRTGVGTGATQFAGGPSGAVSWQHRCRQVNLAASAAW